MIFYYEITKDLAESTYQNLTTFLIYAGPQPSVLNYISGFTTTYSPSGSVLLQGYTDLDISVVEVGASHRIYNTKTETSYGNYSVNNGLAEWAVLIDSSAVGDLLEFSGSNINFLRAPTQNDLFMIVPVSDNTGDGVLRFNSVAFSATGSEEFIETFTLNFKLTA
jgi:hypothetical protein